MTKEELIQMFVDNLTPLVKHDKEINEWKDGSELSNKEFQDLINWMCYATICIMLKSNMGELEQSAIQDCQHYMKVIEKKFEKAGFDDVEKMLIEILEENVEEWIDILETAAKQYREENPQEFENGDVVNQESGNDSTEVAIFKLHTYFLGEVISREDDVIDFIKKYSSVKPQILGLFVTANVYYSHLMTVKLGKINPPKNEPIVKYNKELLNLTEGVLQDVSKKFIIGNVDEDQFDKDMQEIMQDHYDEFIKKMYKRIFKEIQKAQQK